MHCNLRPPEPRQPFPALTTTSCQVWSHLTYPLPYYSVFAADTLLYAETLIFEPATLTFDIWPWTFAAYRDWSDETITKFERNRAISGGVTAILVFDLMTLNIALRVALGSGTIFTKFDLLQLIRVWIIAFLMLIRYVTLWPWRGRWKRVSGKRGTRLQGWKTREWKSRESEKYGKRRFQKCVSDCIDWAHCVETDSNVTAAQRWAEYNFLGVLKVNLSRLTRVSMRI